MLKHSELQTTDTLLMVRPSSFAYNKETSASNAFQVESKEDNVSLLARKESDSFIALLKENNIKVVEVEDTPLPHTPDSVFPNNWFSTHSDGTLILYPMAAPNRREERKPKALEAIKQNFTIQRTVDLTHYEKEGKYLEGTGSLVLDRINHIAYACRSIRTDEEVLKEFCQKMDYRPFLFEARDENGKEIYHTNVLMSVGSEVAIVCLDAVKEEERESLINSLQENGKEIMEISMEQMHHFAGNMLEVRNRNEACLILSLTAYESLNEEQLSFLKQKFRLIVPDIHTIETNGGGSARCMVAEIFE